MSTHVLRPASDTAVDWTSPVGAHYPQLADDSALTAISTVIPAVDRFDLPPLPSFVSGVSAVVAHARFDSTSGLATVRLLLWDGTNLVTGPTWIAPDSIDGGVFSWTPDVPGGGAWTKAKADSLELRVQCLDVAGGVVTCRVAQLEVEAVDAVDPTRVRARLMAPVTRGLFVYAPRRVRLLGPRARARVTAPVARPTLPAPLHGRASIRVLTD